MTIPDSNYLSGRDGEGVEGVICHWTVGTAESALAHFRNPQSRVSSHYIIDREGTRIPVLPESDTAYHAGDFHVNLQTLGIEFVGGEAWGNTFTDAQYAEGSRLLRELSARYGFPLDAQHIRPHGVIVATRCPGTLDIASLIRGVSEEVEVTDNEFIEKYQRLVADAVDQRISAAVVSAVAQALTEASRRLGTPT